MENQKFPVVKFDYNKEQLTEIYKEASEIDKTDIESVKEATKILVKARGIVQKQGKGYRDEATAYNRSVIATEKEYLEIIEPLELEYKEIIKADEQAKIIEARKELLPSKRKQLDALKEVDTPTDEEILEMDDTQWVNVLNDLTVENDRHIEAEKNIEKAKEEGKTEAKEEIAQEQNQKMIEVSSKAMTTVIEAIIKKYNLPFVEVFDLSTKVFDEFMLEETKKLKDGKEETKN